MHLKERVFVSYIEIAEDIAEGQRVENFKVFFRNEDNVMYQRAASTTIGSRRILRVMDDTDTVVVRITSARDDTDIEWIKLY